MSLARWRRNGCWLLQLVLAVALSFAVTIPGCSRSSPTPVKPQETPAAPPASTTARLEQALASDDRVELPGICVEFATAASG